MIIYHSSTAKRHLLQEYKLNSCITDDAMHHKNVLTVVYTIREHPVVVAS